MKHIQLCAVPIDWGTRLAQSWARKNGFSLGKPTASLIPVRVGKRHVGNLIPSRMGFKFIGIPTDDEVKHLDFLITQNQLPEELKRILL